MLYLLSVLIIVLISQEALSTDYCNKDLCLPEITHIACRNYGVSLASHQVAQ